MKIGADLAKVLIVADGATRSEIAARAGIDLEKTSKVLYTAKSKNYIVRADENTDAYDYKGKHALTMAGREKLAALASGEDQIRFDVQFNDLIEEIKANENAPVITAQKGGDRRSQKVKKKEFKQSKPAPKPVQQNLKLNSMSETQRQALLALQDSFEESSNSHQALLEIYEICKKYFGGK